MATNLQIDDKLITEAVNHALLEYIQRMEQKKVLDLFGKIDYDSDYDYKSQRNKR
jgi:hypothetical protein